MASALRDDYLARVGLTTAGLPDLDTLRQLHAAHVAAIPLSLHIECATAGQLEIRMRPHDGAADLTAE